MSNVAIRQRSNADWIAELNSENRCRDEALAELRCAMMNGLGRAFYRYGAESTLIEDSAQVALARVTESLDSFRGDSRFLTWAMSIATRVALSELRRLRWRDVSLDEMVEAGRLPEAAMAVGSHSRKFEQGQLMEVVRLAIENDLTEKQRQAIQAELAGAPPEEIADRMGTNRNALYKVVYDARAKLRQAILSTGWSVEHVRQVLDES